jgi:hypothetical protein
VFVTSEGHAYSRFQRALLTGNLNLIEAAAAELPRVGLDDALTSIHRCVGWVCPVGGEE